MAQNDEKIFLECRRLFLKFQGKYLTLFNSYRRTQKISHYSLFFAEYVPKFRKVRFRQNILKITQVKVKSLVFIAICSMKMLMLIGSCQSSAISISQKQNLTYKIFSKLSQQKSRNLKLKKKEKKEILSYSLVKTAKKTVYCGIFYEFFEFTKIGPQCVQVKVHFPYTMRHKNSGKKFRFEGNAIMLYGYVNQPIGYMYAAKTFF